MKGQLLIVLSDPEDIPELSDRTVAADQYLSSSGDHPSGTTVVNLCRSYRYRSKGYYVSLVADARGHRVLPAVETLEEWVSPRASVSGPRAKEENRIRTEIPMFLALRAVRAQG